MSIRGAGMRVLRDRLRALFWFITDTIVPPSREHFTVRELSSLAGHVAITDVDGSIALTSFQDDVIRSVIHEAKFAGNRKAQRLLGDMLAAYLQARYGDAPIFLVPVPLSSKRYRSRGYNQVSEVVRIALRQLPRASMAHGLVVRARHTTPQTKLSKKGRRTNVRGAFAAGRFARAPKGIADPGAVCLVVDDVLTTGATLSAVRRVLRERFSLDASGLALAH